MKSTEEALGKNFAELVEPLLSLFVMRHTRKHVFELVRFPVHKLQHFSRIARGLSGLQGRKFLLDSETAVSQKIQSLLLRLDGTYVSYLFVVVNCFCYGIFYFLAEQLL